MVLSILEIIYTSPSFAWPRTHLPHILLSLLAVYVLRTLSQGRKTTRDRDLHARTVILTGAFDSALGVTLLVELARRGAGVVCLTERDVGSASASPIATGVKAKEDEEKHPYADPADDPTPSDPLLTPDPDVDPAAYGDPHIHTLITLVRGVTKNANIWAETCDIEDAESVKRFCMKWLTGGANPLSEEALRETEGKAKEPMLPGTEAKGGGGSAPADQRLDAIVFTHEYASLGSLLPKPSWFPALRRRAALNEVDDEKRRERRSLGSFLMTTLLLPSLLVAPVERDIRIMNVVNPFYAAAVRSVDDVVGGSGLTSRTVEMKGTKKKDGKKSSVFLKEGIRSLRTVVLTRHLQRILDALPAPQAPNTNTTSTSIPIPSRKMQKSNIVAVSVSAGVSRVDTVAPLLEADWDVEGERRASLVGIVVYILLQPLLRIFTKSPTSAVQSVLHALFLPTPFKSLAAQVDGGEFSGGSETKSGNVGKEGSEEKGGGGKEEGGKEGIGGKAGMPVFREVLKPGGLYNECAVVTLDALRPLPSSATSSPSINAPDSAAAGERKKAGAKGGSQAGNKGEGKAGAKAEEPDLEIEDDGEYGGEEVGRRVWEAYEGALKIWEGKASSGIRGGERGKA